MYSKASYVVYNIASFLVWTVTSFLCHHFGKLFISISTKTVTDNHVTAVPALIISLMSTVVLTIVQLACCRFFVTSNLGHYSTNVKVYHALATLATNASMAFIAASSTLAIKMTDPVTTVLVVFISTGQTPSTVTSLCLPFIVGGAVVFVANPGDLSTLGPGSFFAFISGFILAFRNVELKKSDLETKVSLKGRLSLLKRIAFLLAVMFFLETSGVLPQNYTPILLYLILSGTFHVIYSYVSTALILTKLSVVSHGIANTMKRLLVVLLLYVYGTRYATVGHFIGLVVCTLALLVYVWDKARPRDVITSKPSKAMKIKQISSISASLILLGIFVTSSFLLTDDRHATNYVRTSKDVFQNRSLPNKVDTVSKPLQTSDGIIQETQKLHFEILGKELAQYKYAFLMDIAAYENKGDPAITLGEVLFLSRMNIEVVHYCAGRSCNDNALKQARKLANKYDSNDLVILLQGGGNIVGYLGLDVIRFKVIDLFSTYKIFVFPQSILIRNWKTAHVFKTKKYYCCNPNLTIVLRDKQSFAYAKQLYNGTTRLLMAPDMAFQIGHIPRFMPPVFDILWIKRSDQETPGYEIPKKVPENVRVHISDWLRWLTPAAGTSLEKAVYVVTNGFFFIQRGRVIITDRLHGHILSTLMDIPHVLIDNKDKKLSSYHNTWTRSLENTVLANNHDDALRLAMQLLHKYNQTLPPMVPFMNIREDFTKPNLSVPIVHYP